MLQKSLEDVGEDLVRAVSDEDVLRFDPIFPGHRCLEGVAVRIGIEA